VGHARVLLLALVASSLTLPTTAAAQQAYQRCQSAQLKAAGQLCRAETQCWSRWVRAPSKDPGGARRAACLAKGEDRFDRAWEKIISRALKKDESCPLDAAPEDFLDDSFRDPLAAIRGDLWPASCGSGSPTRDEARLCASLLQQAGRLCSQDFGLESRNARRPDPGRLAEGRSRARERFFSQVGRALERAAKRGVPDPGVDADGVADAVEALVDDFVQLTSPQLISLAGTIAAADTSVVDGDVNNPLAFFIPNDDGLPSVTLDDFLLAQQISSPATVGGYLNLRGKGPDGPSRRFGDFSDFFEVALSAGEEIVLYIGEDPEQTDLDLCLYDSPFLPPVDCSVDVGAVESLVAPFSGEFWVEVFALSGASTYVLTIGQQAPAAAARTLRLRDEFQPGELIVRLADRAEHADRADAAAACGMQALGGDLRREMRWRLGDRDARDQSFRILATEVDEEAAVQTRRARLSGELALRQDTLLAAKLLRRRADVAGADLNYVRRPAAVPSDPFYNLQWHYPLIHLPQAWDLTTGDASVVVAVVDTGVLLDHPDLQGQLVPGYDFISNERTAGDGDGIDPNPDDPGDLANGGSSSFHGTHVAGTVAAASDNAQGVAGVAWNARVMPLRVLGQGGGTTFDVIQAIRFAAGLPNDSGTVPQQPADIINLSLGGPGFSQATQDAFDEVRAAGSIVIAAAGNNASSAPFYPASYAGVISVSAVDFEKKLAPYSNFGNVDLAAPGGNALQDLNLDGFVDGVLSTLADDSRGEPSFNYTFYQGTSMAAPHVAGVAALMKAVKPDLGPASFDALLEAGSLTEDIGDPLLYGRGLIDAHKAVLAAAGLLENTPRLGVSPSTLSFGAGLTALEVQATNVGGGALSITDVSEDSGGWLAVAPGSVDAEGLGAYSVSVDRTGLALGTYAATITFTSTANSVAVGVAMNVGGAQPADAGLQFALLLDATLTAVAQQPVDVLGGGNPYAFSDVIAAKPGNALSGHYLIVAGTDNDNDGFICDAGEACGAYPTLDLRRPEPFDTNTVLESFSSGFQAALDAEGAAASFRAPGFPGFRLLESPAPVRPRGAAQEPDLAAPRRRVER
jgi:serine protease